MHELSIAMSIVEMAEEEARKHHAQVTAVHLKLGPLSGVVRTALESSFALACEHTALEGSTLVVEEVPVIVFCPRCQARRPLPSIQRFVCPACETPVSDVVQGRELMVTALEIASVEPNQLEVL